MVKENEVGREGLLFQLWIFCILLKMLVHQSDLWTSTLTKYSKSWPEREPSEDAVFQKRARKVQWKKKTITISTLQAIFCDYLHWTSTISVSQKPSNFVVQRKTKIWIFHWDFVWYSKKFAIYTLSTFVHQHQFEITIVSISTTLLVNLKIEHWLFIDNLIIKSLVWLTKPCFDSNEMTYFIHRLFPVVGMLLSMSTIST